MSLRQLGSCQDSCSLTCIVFGPSCLQAKSLTPNAATSTSPADCPAGSYNPGVGASTCQLCPAGTYSQDTGVLGWVL